MKKFWSLILAGCMILMLGTGCQQSAQDSGSGAAGNDSQGAQDVQNAQDAYSVCFLVNGNLGDSGFYDSAAEGVRRLEAEDGCEVKIIEMGMDETKYETYFRDVSEQGWDLIIAATWSVLDLYQEIAEDYPDQKYLFLDGEVTPENMIGISYMSNETGFMAGCLAAKMLDSGAPKIDAGNRTLGVCASMDSTNLNNFVVGYIEGVKYVDPAIRVICSYVNSFEDVATCMEMVTQLYNQGAQVVYAPTSQSMMGAVTASSNSDKYLILCDTDVYSAVVGTDANAVRNVISSSLKKVGDSVCYAVRGIRDGSLAFGESYVLGLAEGTVGLASNENYEAVVPQEIRTELDEIAQKVVNGEIEIASAYDMETSEIEALRDSMKP